MSEKRHPKGVSDAGKTLSDPDSSKKAKKEAAKKLKKHQDKKH